MSVKIIIDSSSDVNPNISYRLNIVPLTLHFGKEDYLDGVDITYDEFYKKLVECDTLPTTSQASPFAFGEAFEKVVSNGDTAVVITLSSKLSGTYQSAMIAADDYEGKIFVVDSQSAAIGSGVLAEFALKLSESGMSAKDIAKVLIKERENICLVAMLDTLEYLKRGGRISKTVAFAGGILSIKPVICLEDGEIKVLGKARGTKQGNALMVTEIDKTGGIDFDKPVLLGYTGVEDTLLQKFIEDSTSLWKCGTDNLNKTPICSVIGTHVGPGAFAAAFFKK